MWPFEYLKNNPRILLFFLYWWFLHIAQFSHSEISSALTISIKSSTIPKPENASPKTRTSREMDEFWIPSTQHGQRHLSKTEKTRPKLPQHKSFSPWWSLNINKNQNFRFGFEFIYIHRMIDGPLSKNCQFEVWSVPSISSEVLA